MDLTCVNAGGLFVELETILDIESSASHSLDALLRLRYHDLPVVDDLRLEVYVCVRVWQPPGYEM